MVFRTIGPELWRRTRHNPLDLLQGVQRARLDELAVDPSFLERYDAVMQDFSAVVEGRNTWFADTFPEAGDPFGEFRNAVYRGHTLSRGTGGCWWWRRHLLLIIVWAGKSFVISKSPNMPSMSQVTGFSAPVC